MKHSKFAQMNNVAIEVTGETAKQSDNQQPTSEIVETNRAVAHSPIIKMMVIGGGILMFILLIGSILNSSLNLFSTERKIEPTAQQQTEDTAQPINEAQKDKTLLALTTQSNQLKSIREQKGNKSPTPTPTVSPTTVASSTPSTPTKAVPIQKQPVTVQKNPPFPKPQASVTPVTRNRSTTTPTAPTRPLQTTPPQNRVVSPPIRPTVTTQKIDPMQQWETVANAGSFSGAGGEEAGIKEINSSGIRGGIGFDKQSTGQDVVADDNSNVNSTGKRILVGSTSTGKLETPIVWAANGQSTQNYLVRITSEIKASDGTVVVPANSFLVVQNTNTNTDGYAQLYGTAILVNANGDTIQKKLPANAVRILASNGEMLKGRSGRGSNFMQTISTATLAGITKAASIVNGSSTSTTTSSSGFFSSTTSNENQDTLAGFGEGAFGSILEEIKSNNQRLTQSNNRNTVYMIEAGKTVRIYINETISI